MILFELTNSEAHPVYQTLEAENGARQYAFIRSVVNASLAIDRPFLSQHVIKALNFHAITCLHINPGEYRPCDVRVGDHRPPEFFRVPALMDDFVNRVNRAWEKTDAVHLATYVLWRLNNIHPFINGNGRTARAACLFVLCLKAEGYLPGVPALPELIRRERSAYCEALQAAHESFAATGEPELQPLYEIVSKLVQEQLESAGIAVDAEHQSPPPPPPPPSPPEHDEPPSE